MARPRSLLAAAVITLLAAVSVLTAPSAHAAGPCVLHSDGNCGPYYYPAISASNGYTTYTLTRAGNGSGPQVLTSFSPGRWHIVSRQPGVPGSVEVAYAQVSQDFTNRSWTHFAYIRSGFAQSLPRAGTWIAAYDVLLDGPGPVTDVMTITAERGHGQFYLDQVIGHAVIGGRAYTVFRGQGGSAAFDADQGMTAGTVHLLAELRWLRARGLVSPAAGVSQVDYGFGIASTGRGAATFAVTGFSLSTSCLPGHAGDCGP